ncbi:MULTISPECIES: colicin E3-like toxin immunity protein [Bacteroidota]|uniref:DUF7683 domain-containing protein n=1 Tax=Sphingobacterium multivorum TaxID=28454 RepID=A0A2X2L327_SPHMU|nr:MULTISPECIES: colicin E3-like toxin immunity protein [Bacteroidota]QQT31927.1 hypothetical protein I6I99_04995 [Sphingobacterium multivorum]QRQ59845.1 hypothetical protein I6J33_16935 [Sphingobacterium multivorum]SPZ83630.1 Uncharacterised protein [Sphingobacterium multivorum]
MKIGRIISWFDRRDERLIGEFNIDFIPLDLLKETFRPPIEDPLMYNPYDINIAESEILKKYVDIEFEFDKYIYQIDCFQA